MQRTTIALEDELHRALRLRAAERGKSLALVVNEVLRRGLRALEDAPPAAPTAWKTYRCGKAFVDITDRDALYRAMEDR